MLHDACAAVNQFFATYATCRPSCRQLTQNNVVFCVTFVMSTCCFQRRAERLGVTKRHELVLVLTLLLHVQNPGTYFTSSYTYRKLNNFRLTWYTIQSIHDKIQYTQCSIFRANEGEKTRINTINYRLCWSSINTQWNMRPFAADYVLLSSVFICFNLNNLVYDVIN